MKAHRVSALGISAFRISVLGIPALAVAIAGLSTAAFGAGAADLPVLKSGLWEVTRASTQKGDSKHLTTMCLDESVQAEMREFSLGVAKEMCSKNDRKIEGNRMTVSATCTLGPTTMTTHSVMLFTGTTAYHTTATAHYDPPFMNMTDTQSTVDGKWVGPCKPDQQPGDIVTETGQKINMKSMMKK